jgi:aminoglycoside phosphotransferase (APT) family kinase protein
VERIVQCLAHLRPRTATWGLRHGDFCRENLVEHAAGLCCIDNATVRPGVLELDLAQTFYRWPMTPGGRAAFLDGYGGHADPRSFCEHEVFWQVAAGLRSAGWRLREGTAGIETPLAHLETSLRAWPGHA